MPNRLQAFLLVSFLPRVRGMAPAKHRHNHRIEVLIGRSAALCLHPLAAWRSPAKSDRAMLLISYFALSYVLVFGLLHAISA